MIDARFSRDAFESLRTPVERRQLARDLGDEIVGAIAAIPTADGALSAVLARLRLIGHHLYPNGEGVFAGTSSDGSPPTGLTLHFRPDAIDVHYAPPR